LKQRRSRRKAILREKNEPIPTGESGSAFRLLLLLRKGAKDSISLALLSGVLCRLLFVSLFSGACSPVSCLSNSSSSREFSYRIGVLLKVLAYLKEERRRRRRRTKRNERRKEEKKKKKKTHLGVGEGGRLTLAC